MKFILSCVFVVALQILYAQNVISGQVLDTQHQPLFAVNIYLDSNLEIGVISDFSGQFVLEVEDSISDTDSIVVSSLGFLERKFPVIDWIGNEKRIVLTRKENSIPIVSVIGKRTISDAFSLESLNSLEIYLNPLSQGDPLRALGSLPSSTNTGQSANPILRGSDADRTRVVFNNIPVYQPVRNSQINGLGNFSLFNTALIEKQDIYASNPPLTYGNSSGGLVEIQTKDRIEENGAEVSISLANIGYLISDTLKGKSFLQWYGNYQFHQAFVGVNSKNFADLKSFGSIDNGFNFHHKFSKKTSFNLFNYFIDEHYEYNVQTFNVEEVSSANNTRDFLILNFNISLDKGELSFNQGLDYLNNNYELGNIKSLNFQRRLYTSINYKMEVNRKNSLKVGMDFSAHSFEFTGENPVVYYALNEEAPTETIDGLLKNNFLESFVFYQFKHKNIAYSLATRMGLSLNNPDPYFSVQTSLRYQANRYHSLLFGMGRYHNFSTPYSYNQRIALQSSYQFTIDYGFKRKNVEINSAMYYKREYSDVNMDVNSITPFNREQIFGLELQQAYRLNENIKVIANYTYLLPKIYSNNRWITGSNELNYFVKLALDFNYPKVLNFNINYQIRNGLAYNSFQEGYYDNFNNIYHPDFSTMQVSRYNTFHNLSLGLSKYMSFKDKSLILFLNIDNVLNTKNQQSPYYSQDYSQMDFNLYQLRSIYFGALFKFR